MTRITGPLLACVLALANASANAQEKLKYFSDDTRVVYVSAQDQRRDIDMVRAERDYVWDYETRYPRHFDTGKTIAVLQ